MNQGVSLFYAPLGDNAGAGYIKQPGCASLPILAFHIADGNVSCSPGLLNALAACASDLEQAKSSDPRAIASSLKQVLAKVLQTSAQPPRPSVAACIQVSKQLELLGWDRVTAVEENFCSVGLVHVGRRGDGGGAHALRLFLDVQGRPYECMSDTPLPFVLLPSNVSSVSEAYARFATHVARFEQVWQELEEVDASARVLDPPLPANRGLCYRRLGLLDENQGLSIATLHVQMAIDNPRGAPCSCELIGPETAIAPHRGRLDAMFRDWNPGWSVLRNLAHSLRLAPACTDPLETNELVDAGECGICYTFRLPSENGASELPDVSCECRRPFHQSCLLGWLRSLPSAKRSFRLIAGECP